jgi:hypothetical protein
VGALVGAEDEVPEIQDRRRRGGARPAFGGGLEVDASEIKVSCRKFGNERKVDRRKSVWHRKCFWLLT